MYKDRQVASGQVCVYIIYFLAEIWLITAVESGRVKIFLINDRSEQNGPRRNSEKKTVMHILLYRATYTHKALSKNVFF